MPLTDLVQRRDHIIQGAPLERLGTGFIDVIKAQIQASDDNHSSISRQTTLRDQTSLNRKTAEGILGRAIKPEDAPDFKPFEEPEISGAILSGTGINRHEIPGLREKHNSLAILG